MKIYLIFNIKFDTLAKNFKYIKIKQILNIYSKVFEIYVHLIKIKINNKFLIKKIY